GKELKPTTQDLKPKIKNIQFSDCKHVVNEQRLAYRFLGFRSWVVGFSSLYQFSNSRGGHMQSENKIESYRDLHVWQKAMDLIVECYRLTEKLPPSENFGLISGIRRAAILVASYIADGKGRNNTVEYLQKLSAAGGSLKVVET